MILIGLTGGIASGKSTVSTELQQQHGIRVIDCDKIVRSLQQPNSAAVRAIAREWPSCVESYDGVQRLSREKLGAIVFKDPHARRKLAAIMNWRIFVAVIREIFSAWWQCTSSNDVAVLDAPTLLETRTFVRFVSSITLIYCDDDLQRQRLKSRDPHLSDEECNHRISSQMSWKEKQHFADFMIDNSTNDIDVLKERVAVAVGWMRKQPRLWYPSVVAAATGLLTAVAALVFVRVVF